MPIKGVVPRVFVRASASVRESWVGKEEAKLLAVVAHGACRAHSRKRNGQGDLLMAIECWILCSNVVDFPCHVPCKYIGLCAWFMLGVSCVSCYVVVLVVVKCRSCIATLFI